MASSFSPSTTRNQLLRAASEEILRTGYAGASLARMAARIGYTKGSLAYHFPTKETILAALLEETIESDLKAHRRATKAFPDSPIRALLAHLASISFLGTTNPITRAASTISGDPSVPLSYCLDNHIVWRNRMEDYFEGAEDIDGYTLTVPPHQAARRLLVTTAGDQAISRFYEEDESRPRLQQLQPCLVSLGIHDADQIIQDVKDAEFFYANPRLDNSSFARVGNELEDSVHHHLSGDSSQ